MAAHFAWLQQPFGEKKPSNESPKQRSRPFPLRMRTYSVAGLWSPGFDENRDGMHTRNKSLSVAHDVSDFSPTSLSRIADDEDGDDSSDEETARTSVEESPSVGFTDPFGLSMSPGTPLTSIPSERSSLDFDGPEVLAYDFSKIDYELERAKVLGQGLWSTVYMAEQKRTRTSRLLASSSSPTSTLRRWSRHSRSSSTPTLFAVKLPSRQDASEIFQQEARILTHLMRRPSAVQHIVSFYGLDARNGALVSEAISDSMLARALALKGVLVRPSRSFRIPDSAVFYWPLTS